MPRCPATALPRVRLSPKSRPFPTGLSPTRVFLVFPHGAATGFLLPRAPLASRRTENNTRKDDLTSGGRILRTRAKTRSYKTAQIFVG